MTDEQVLAAADAAGYVLVERDVEDIRMWAWVGVALAPGWWPSRTGAIEYMRSYLLDHW
jgi:hypothetical protein